MRTAGSCDDIFNCPHRTSHLTQKHFKLVNFVPFVFALQPQLHLLKVRAGRSGAFLSFSSGPSSPLFLFWSDLCLIAKGAVGAPTVIMSTPQANEAEKNIEIWKVKKLIKRLEAARGNGTSMISLIIRKFY